MHCLQDLPSCPQPQRHATVRARPCPRRRGEGGDRERSALPIPAARSLSPTRQSSLRTPRLPTDRLTRRATAAARACRVRRSSWDHPLQRARSSTSTSRSGATSARRRTRGTMGWGRGTRGARASAAKPSRSSDWSQYPRSWTSLAVPRRRAGRIARSDHGPKTAASTSAARPARNGSLRG